MLVTCEKCHGREVALHITGRKRFEARAGRVKKDDDKIVYVPLNTPEENLQWSAHLTCLNPDWHPRRWRTKNGTCLGSYCV